MGLIIRPDDIGTFSEAGGTFTLGASRLTIGGQQYVTTSAVQVTPSGLSTETLYRVYAVVTNGAVSIVESTNNVASGPAGFDSWLLIGHFWFSFNSNISVVTPAVDGKFANLPPVSVKLGRLTDQTGLGTGVTVVQWNTTRYDNWDAFDSASFGISVPLTRRYDFKSAIATGNLGSGDRMILAVRADAAGAGRWTGGGTVTNMGASGSFDRSITAAQVIDVTVDVVTDANWDVAAGENGSFLSMEQIEKTGLVRDEDL
jgi:hypothetical protein